MNQGKDQSSTRKRGWRRLIPIFIPVLLLTLLITAQSIISNSPQFRYSQWYNAILSLFIININIILILVLLVVIFRHLVKLFSERKRQILGSRFRTKIVLTMIFVILVPTMLVYVISSDLISKSIDQWYEQTVETIVRSSHNLSTKYLEDYENLLHEQARQIAEYISRENLLNNEKVFYVRQQYMEPLMERLHFDVAELFLGREKFGVTIVDPDTQILPYLEETDPERLTEALTIPRAALDHNITWSQTYPNGTLIRTLVPVYPRGDDPYAIGAVSLGFVVQQNLAAIAGRIASDYNYYREQIDNRDVVKLASQGLLLIFTLISLFSAIWIGIYFSRGFTVPIQKLAEGTRAVAAGNLDYRVEATSNDEVGILVSSFNEMTKQLKESKAATEAANETLMTANLELERRQRYTETLLSNLSSAVISLDDAGKVNTVNSAASRLLNIQTDRAEGQPWWKVFERPDLAPLNQLLTRHFEHGIQGITEQINIRSEKQLLHLSATVTAIHHSDGSIRGTLIVVDNLTQLMRAQRTAAWQEVAQRIAHEIKNPLTPIQLSAERIRRRFILGSTPGGNGEETGDTRNMELLSSATETIIEETGTLKSMVDAFSSFARMPQVNLRRGDVAQVLEKATSIYSTDHEGNGFRISMDYNGSLPVADIDPDQLKMAFVNLINNAIDAMDGSGQLEVRAHYQQQSNEIIVEFIDEGPGITAETKDKLFLPYFSTKKKGTGLGLAIVSRIISDHHGTISVQDNTPKGAVFTIRLPAL